jgi:transposase
MMGPRQVEQGALFYNFSLDAHVPGDHLLRSIDRFVDLSEVRRELAPFYSAMGRPSVDPELKIRMLIVGYCFGIRSERRLCEEVHLNLAYRWFCRLGLQGDIPDHSTFSKNRHGRFRESDLLRRVFEAVLRRCIDEGVVGGEGFAVDGSLIKADASRQKGIDGSSGLPTEAAGRAAREYLAVLDDAAFGAATPVTPKFISPADPSARWTGAHGGQAFFAYSANYLIDTDNAIIVDVEATTAIRQAEVTAAKRMIERAMERFDLYPARLAGDSAYGRLCGASKPQSLVARQNPKSASLTKSSGSQVSCTCMISGPISRPRSRSTIVVTRPLFGASESFALRCHSW